MIRISQLKIAASHTTVQLRKKAAGILGIRESEILSLFIVRRSIDARKKPDIYYSYVVDVETINSIRRTFQGNQVYPAVPVIYRFPPCGNKPMQHRPVIVGTGPTGLFCGYFLSKYGYRPILLERGEDVDTRRQHVEAFWKGEKLKPHSNVQFGEGGAGTFSDGKLNTLVKDKSGRNRAVLETFAAFGAKEDILYEAKPHIGTDALCGIVKRMREEIIRLGGEVRFRSEVTDLFIEDGKVTGVQVNRMEEKHSEEKLLCDTVVLAIGHSARDTFDLLWEKAIPMEAKSFAVGLRVEHPQEMINLSQYGMSDPGALGAAAYKVTAGTSVGRSVYSFCMCPGGYVVNATSEEGHLAVNGMSYSGRDGKNANSAIIVAVSPEDFGSEHPLAGIAFQRELEQRAYEAGQGRIPIQRYGDFRAKVTEDAGKIEQAMANNNGSSFEPEVKGDFLYADLTGILPEECNRAFVEGMEQFGRQIPGFDRPDAILSGVESRTSSPVRILRGEDMQSEVKGIYPCGEGAGYAGGITSAAMDGIRVAEAIAGVYANFNV